MTQSNPVPDPTARQSIADVLAAVAEQLPADDPEKGARTLAGMTTPAERATARYNTDPDALAWARARVQHQLDRLAAFEAHATENGRTELAAGLSMARRSTAQMLLGGDGCVVGAFDERRPRMFAAPQGAATAGPAAGRNAPYAYENRAVTEADPALLLRVEQDGRNSMSGCMRPADIPALLRQLADRIAAQLGQVPGGEEE